jgi:hypothetical protein
MKNDLESMVRTLVSTQQDFITYQKQINAKHEQASQRLEVQVGQMAKELSGRMQDEFPAQTIPNLEGH